MPTSYWGYWLIVMGVAIVGLMISVQGVTTNTTQDYYSIKEMTEASMLEAVDYGYYRDYNEVKINKEKFMEVFLRMLAETITNETYEVNFYEMYEAPPKVSVEIRSHSGANFIEGDYDTTSRIDAIIQTYAEKVTTSTDYTPGSSTNDDDDETDSGTTEDNTTVGTTNNGTNGSNTGGTTGSTTGGTTTGGTTTTDILDTVSDTCKKGISSTNLKNIQGTSLTTGNNSNIYKTLDGIGGTTIGQAKPGTKFTILGTDESHTYWAIKYGNECGWVTAKYMAINLNQYLSTSFYGGRDKVKFNITNRSGSIYKIFGGNISGITGQKLYSSEFDGFTPLNWLYAKDLANIIETRVPSGYKLVIYDAYRPKAVSEKVYSTVLPLAASGNTGTACYGNQFNCDNGYTWHVSWFIANSSNHNKGCALDVGLEKDGKVLEAYSPMHELSVKSLKYTNSYKNKYSAGYLASDTAQQLHQIMMVSGITDIPSEWWHYDHTACNNTISQYSSFWSNV